MAKTLKNFLVGVGFDYDKKGADEVGSGIDSIKSKALQLGAVVAGAFGIKSLTADFAASTDMLGKFGRYLDVDADMVSAFGRALEHEGGSLTAFMGQLENIERMRAGLAVGDAGFIAAAGRAGIDTAGLIEATNATEAYLALADQFAAMTSQGRLNAADALGLDAASIRLLSQGRSAVEDLVSAEQARRPITSDMTEEAARFNDEMQDLKNNIGGIADEISTKLLPMVNGLIEGMNDFIEGSRDSFSMVVNAWNLDQQEASQLTGFELPDYFFKPIEQLNDEDLNRMGADISRLGSHIAGTLTGPFESGQPSRVEPWFPRPERNPDDTIGSSLSAFGLHLADTLAAPFSMDSMSVTPMFPRPERNPDDTIGSGLSAFGLHIADTLTAPFSMDSMSVTPMFPRPERTGDAMQQSRSGGQSPAMPPITIEMPVILDGQVIERKVREVNERSNRDAFDSIKSPIEG